MVRKFFVSKDRSISRMQGGSTDTTFNHTLKMMHALKLTVFFVAKTLRRKEKTSTFNRVLVIC